MKKLIAVILVLLASPTYISGIESDKATSSSNPNITEFVKTIISGSNQSKLLSTHKQPNAFTPESQSKSFLFAPDSINEMVVFAGNDSTICLNTDSIEVSGYAENYHFVSWAHTGDGFFYNAIKLNTAYVPGSGDVSAGYATLYLIGIGVPPNYLRLVDSVTYTIVPKPSCFAGYNTTICENENYRLQGQASNYSAVLWSTSGDGTFDYPDILDPVYFPGESDLQLPQIDLWLTAFQNAPCVFPASNPVHISIERVPVVYAGSDTIFCEGGSLQLDAQVFNFNEVLWLTSGNGTFSNMFGLSTEYFPGDEDVNHEWLELTIVASPNLPCIANVSDNLLVDIISFPQVEVGPNQTICDENVVQCSAIVDDYDYCLWYTVGGNGTFDDATILNPTYTLGDLERTSGEFYLLLCTIPIEPCVGLFQDVIEVKIQDSVQVFAGDDFSICQSNSATLSGQVNFSDSYFWSASGDGTFANNEILMANYFPGIQDIQNGMVELVLEATSIAPCNLTATDTVQIFITMLPDVFAGDDRTACTDAGLTGMAENYSGVFWTSTGDGTFSNQYDLNTIYSAGSSDIENEQVVLSLNVGANAPCYTFLSDSITLHFDQAQILSQNMEDQELNVGDSLALNFEVASQLEGSYQWFFNDLPLDNFIDNFLIIDNLLPTQAGTYYCKYSNACAEVLSDTSFVVLYEQSFQTFAISNGWNTISSYIYPPNPSMEFVLNPILDDLIILFNDEGVFYPGFELMTFKNWSAYTGYVLKTTEPGYFEISGIIKYPLDPVVIAPGWSLFPVNAKCAVEVEGLFEACPAVQIIKELGGLGLYWPQKEINTLENIHPGKAYEIFNASNTEISITFPGCED